MSVVHVLVVITIVLFWALVIRWLVRKYRPMDK